MNEQPQWIDKAKTLSGMIELPYSYTVGATGSKFFVELRDKRKITGIKCHRCNRVYVPPRSTCPRCFDRLEEWVELSGQGTLLTFTSINYSLPVHPAEPPFIYGIIQLDGADTGFTHLIGESDPDDIEIGMRLEPVFSDEPEGNILDIRYFRPVP